MPKRVLQNRLSEAAEAVRTSPSQRAAAALLGVNVSTISRAIRDGRIPPPGPRTRQGSTDAGNGRERFSDWARRVYVLSRPELELVALAQHALDLAADLKTSPNTRLQAMATFRTLVRELRLPIEGEMHGNTTKTVRFPRPA